MGPSRSLGVVLCLLPLGNLVVGTLWALDVFPGAPATALQIAGWVLTTVLSALAAWWFWRHQKNGVLAWNGAQWRWLQDRAQPFDEGRLCQSVEVRADWQHCLLLRVCWHGKRPIERGCADWFWADRSRDRQAWHLLRCAVYFRPPPASGPNPDG